MWFERIVPLINPSADGLFPIRDDPADPRFGDRLARDRGSLLNADVVLLGFPEDEGVRRNRGRPGAGAAPAQIRTALGRLPTAAIDLGRFADLGDTLTGPTLEDGHARHQQVVEALIAAGKRVIVLGGGNDVSFPDVAGLAAAAGPVFAVNIDNHFDVRSDRPANSGTPYRQLIEGCHLKPTAFVELGEQPWANSAIYRDWLSAQGVQRFTLADLQRHGHAALLQPLLTSHADHAQFWGFDTDVVSAADAPGVSAPNPAGMRAERYLELVEFAAAQPQTRLIEFSEFNPAYDIDGRTARLVAVAVWTVLQRWVS
jgi:formiminoglutamase